MQVETIFRANCSEWNYEIGGNNHYPEDNISISAAYPEIQKEIEKRNKEKEWDEDRNRNISKL